VVNAWKRSIAILVILLLTAASIVVMVHAASEGAPGGEGEASEPTQDAQEASPDRSSGYRLTADNGQFKLYVHPETLGIRVENKRTGYVWRGALDEKDERLNKTWQAFFESGLTIEYMDVKQKVSMAPVSGEGVQVNVEGTADGFTAKIVYEQLGIELALRVQLEGDALSMSVPQDSIREMNEDYRLQSLYLYPFFGATKGVQEEQEGKGYMLIPDGSGALISLNERTLASQPYIGKVYGPDLGMGGSLFFSDGLELAPEQVYVPAFGIALREGADAYVSLITGGAAYAEIRAYPSGVTTEYNWTTARWLYRENYFQPTDKKGNGVTLNQRERNRFDAARTIMLLSGDQADYSGMAKRLRQELTALGMLPAEPRRAADGAAIRIEFIAAENKQRMIGREVIPMTTLAEMDNILSDLKASGVERMLTVVRGWSAGGITGSSPTHFPFERKVGSGEEWKQFVDKYELQGIPVYFYTNYTLVDQSADGYGKTDIAQAISRQQIEPYWNAWLLRPDVSRRLFEEELRQFERYNMKHVAFDWLGSLLFSTYERSPLTREEAIHAYQSMLAENKAGGYALYSANHYLWNHADIIFELPMGSSRFLLATEEVPFLQLVLKGAVDYYSPVSNFHADSREERLKMIDYGSYPSFIITARDPVELLGTGSNWLYTSQYSVWKDQIIEEYQMVSQALRAVDGASFEKREEVRPGVYRNRYSNGVIIYVNYTQAEASIDGVTIPAQGYLVREGSGI
jgi:hypothetical protein